MTDLPARLGGYEIAITPLKTGGRADVVVTNANETPDSFTSTAIVDQLRAFFDKLEAEADARKDDPIAMVNALARMEALLADVRYVTNTIRDHTATALNNQGIRRLTVEGVATMEGTSASERTDWQDRKLLQDMIAANIGRHLADTESGNMWDATDMSAEILTWMRPAWRLTPIRDAGLNPDDYSHQPQDEDGKPLRTPTVRVHDNRLKGDQIARSSK